MCFCEKVPDVDCCSRDLGGAGSAARSHQPDLLGDQRRVFLYSLHLVGLFSLGCISKIIFLVISCGFSPGLQHLFHLINSSRLHLVGGRCRVWRPGEPWGVDSIKWEDSIGRLWRLD